MLHIPLPKLNFHKAADIISTKAGRPGLVAKKYAPHAMTGIGMAGVVTTAVLASKATLKAGVIHESMKQDLDMIHEVKALAATDGLPDGQTYSNEDYIKDLITAYVKAGKKYLRLYGPTLISGAITLSSIFGGQAVTLRRNAALAAAYTGLEELYKRYRERVVDEYGAEKDMEFHRGLKTTERTHTDEEGKKHKVKSYSPVKEGDRSYSIYARAFDQTNPNHQSSPAYNLTFLKCQQTYFNDMLHARGHVFLNEVYDALGFDRTKAGACVGWVEGHGDSFVDFGIFDASNAASRRFINGLENSILLDFNVDGTILDLI